MWYLLQYLWACWFSNARIHGAAEGTTYAVVRIVREKERRVRVYCPDLKRDVLESVNPPHVQQKGLEYSHVHLLVPRGFCFGKSV